MNPVKCTWYGDVPWDDIQKDEHGQLPPGAMFWITFSGGLCENHLPGCERHLMVVCPDGHWWNIDSRCSNCTMKDDRVHRCWVRHGEPPNITVDKNGVTCQAGGGSIQTPDWHGFLRNGELVS